MRGEFASVTGSIATLNRRLPALIPTGCAITALTFGFRV
jgi:hypothetical protein